MWRCKSTELLKLALSESWVFIQTSPEMIFCRWKDIKFQLVTNFIQTRKSFLQQFTSTLSAKGGEELLTFEVLLVNLMNLPSGSTSEMSRPPLALAERAYPELELLWLYSSTASEMSTRLRLAPRPAGVARPGERLVCDVWEASSEMFSLRRQGKCLDDHFFIKPLDIQVIQLKENYMVINKNYMVVRFVPEVPLDFKKKNACEHQHWSSRA